MTERAQIVKLPEPLRSVRLPPGRPVDEQEPEEERDRAVYERGWRDGEKALNEELLKQRHEMVELQQGVLKSLGEAVPHVMSDCQEALTALTLELAQKLVAGLPMSMEMVQAAVQEALAEVEETTDCNIYLHPDDLELLQKSNSPLLSNSGLAQRLHFHPLPDVSRGGCLVKTRFGIIDAQRESKIEQLKKSLLS